MNKIRPGTNGSFKVENVEKKNDVTFDDMLQRLNNYFKEFLKENKRREGKS